MSKGIGIFFPSSTASFTSKIIQNNISNNFQEGFADLGTNFSGPLSLFIQNNTFQNNGGTAGISVPFSGSTACMKLNDNVSTNDYQISNIDGGVLNLEVPM